MGIHPKDCMGPTPERPGPIFARVAITDVTAVVRSGMKRVMRKDAALKSMKNSRIKPIMFEIRPS